MFLALLLAGCDVDLLGEKRDARRREAEERAQQEERRRETEEMRVAVANYAKGRRQAFQKRQDELSKEEASLREDMSKLVSAITDGMAEKDSRGNDQKYETKVLHILRNPDVNALAIKHIASDFSGTVATFIERVREARAADARYAAAVRDAEENYQEGVKSSKKWSEMSQQQRADEISRLEREISSLETSRDNVRKEYKNVTRNSMLGGVRQERQWKDNKDVIDRKVFDIDRQIAVKRRQIDVLRNPHEQRHIASMAVRETQYRQEDAIRIRNVALDNINRQLKPEKSLTDVVAEFEKNTIGKLRSALSEKISKLEAETTSLKQRIVAVDEALLSIPLSDIGDLKRIKSQLDR